MRLLPSPFTPSPGETPLAFGVSWAALGSMMAMVMLASCAYFIPESTNAPRYNTVEGERRPPALNPSSAAPRTDLRVSQDPAYQPQSQMSLTPVTPAAPMAVEQPFVQTMPAPQTAAPSPASVPQTSYDWWDPAGWFASDAPPPASAPAASRYPQLQDTPPSPVTTGQAAARENLMNGQSDLEASRTAAGMRASQLSTDAAAEPSLLAPLPPAASPVPPAPPVPPVPPAPSVVRPSSTSAPLVVTPDTSGATAEATIQEPIMLRPPQGEGVPVATNAGQSTSMTTMDPSVSTFDPMIGADVPPPPRMSSGVYPGSGYLPPSRYQGRESY